MDMYVQVGTLYDLLDLSWSLYEEFCVDYEQHDKQVSAVVKAAMLELLSRTDMFPHLKSAKEQGPAPLNAQLESEKLYRQAMLVKDQEQIAALKKDLESEKKCRQDADKRADNAQE